jgi:beta-galactosidase
MFLKRVSILFLAFLPLTVIPNSSQARERLNFDAGWLFHRGEITSSKIETGLVLKGWRWKDAGKTKPSDEILAAPGVKTGGSDWKDAANGQDVFNQQVGFAWYRLTLPNSPGPRRILHFAAVDDNATVWVNGKKMIYHEGWNEPFDVPLDEVWKEGGPNEVAVLVENTAGAGYIKEADLVDFGKEEKAPPAAQADYDDRSWKPVHLPHDFVVEGTFDPKADGSHGFLPKDPGWYRKSFDLPLGDKGRCLWIDFDGVYRDSRVWLNGKILGKHASGYTSFRYDISDAAIYGGKNNLTVYVDARVSEGWWYEGGGIYRHVWLTKADPLHVKPWGTYVVSRPMGSKASLVLETTLTNRSGSSTSFKLVSEIKDEQGKSILKISSPGKAAPGAEVKIIQKGQFNQAVLWSLENPYLYTWVTRVESAGQLVDQMETPFGVRSIRFDKDKGFFLNGKPVKIKGTCNHQDFAGLGTAIPDRIFNYRIEKLKEMGSNAYRCSHNPPAPELLDACDRLGMLVMDENRKLGDTPEILSQVESMLLRDRNHPSIFLWSLCNEESLQGTKEGCRRGEAMKEVVKKYDKTRLVTAAMNYGWGGDGLSNALELQGFNYAIDQYDAYRISHPKVPLYGSETASTVSTRGIYVTDKVRGYVSAYDVNHTEWAYTAEAAWRPIAERPWMAGVFLWTGFDYRGEPTPYNWPCVNSHFGILDMCGFPKDNFYYYQSWWGDKPTLHLYPHWNWPGKEGQQVDVWCQNNYDMVELFLNGRSLGKQETPKNGHLEWKVWYEPGTLTAKALHHGQVVVETKVETTGEPAQVKLEPYQTKMLADGEDTLPVAVSILDDHGRLMPIADNLVTFRVTGPAHIAGVGNGDPSSHEPDKAEQRKAFNGLCMVLVQANDVPGAIELTATSPGLKSATIELRSVAH